MNLNHKTARFYLTLFVVAACSFFSCKNEGGSERGIEEIQTSGKISEIIRSPVSASGETDTVNVAKMVFSETTFDFGEIQEGDLVEHVFKFKNTGKVALVISDAHSTCGCTVPEWPKNPVPPGQDGELKVTFNSLNKPNSQEKPVIISANTYPSVTRVYLKGFVHKKS